MYSAAAQRSAGEDEGVKDVSAISRADESRAFEHVDATHLLPER